MILRLTRLIVDAAVVGLGLWAVLRLLVAGAISAFPGTLQ